GGGGGERNKTRERLTRGGARRPTARGGRTKREERGSSQRRAEGGSRPAVKTGKAAVTGELGVTPREATQTSGPTGVLAMACLQREIGRNTGSPTRWRCVTSNRTPARDRPGRLG